MLLVEFDYQQVNINSPEQILIEYNEQRLIHDFGNKLVNHYKLNFPYAPESDYNPILIINSISYFDPTSNKELTFWIVNNYANNRIHRWEDISSRAVPALLKFKALLRKPNLNPPLQIRDINQIKGLTQLEDIIEKYPDQEAESQSEQEDNFYKSNQAELLYNSDILKVIIPKTEEASCYFGKGTRWCTAAKNNNMFDEYVTPDDPDSSLYIIIVKGTNEKYQLHFPSEQYMNARDEEINPLDLFKKFPELLDIFTPNTQGTIYERIIKSIDNRYWQLKLLVANDKNTPPEILDILSKSDIPGVLSFVAGNQSTSAETIEKMVLNIIDLLKKGILHYMNADTESLLRILIFNKNISTSALGKIIKLCKNYPYRFLTITVYILRTSKISSDVLHEFSTASNEQIRSAVASNPHTPTEDLNRMIFNDSSPLVANLASITLEKLGNK